MKRFRRCGIEAESLPRSQRSRVRSRQSRNFFNFSLGLELGGGGAETRWLVSVLNILALNPKSFRSASDVKEYVQLVAISPSDGDVKPSGPLGAYDKSSLISTPDFTLTLPQLTFIIHYTTIQHTHTHIHPWRLTKLVDTCQSKWCRNRKLVTLPPLPAVKRVINSLSIRRAGIRNTHTHISTEKF